MLECKKCRLCGSFRAKDLFNKDVFTFIRCLDCRSVYVNPILSEVEINKLYGKEYFKSSDSLVCGYEDYIRDYKDIVATFGKRLKEIEIHKTPGQILDIGCAMGFLLEVAKERGWKAHGIDISHYATEYAKKRINSNIFTGNLAEAEFSDESFDVIVAWDVLEHLAEPLKFLKEVNRILKKGGLVSIITPNVTSLLARISGKKWVEFKKPREHLCYFSSQALRKTLEDLGFEILQITSAGKVVSLDFVINRLRNYSALLFNALDYVARRLNLGHLKFYVNPGDKMHMCASKIKPS